MLVRGLTDRLRAALADTRVVFLHGPRQSGKTTLARYVAQLGSPRTVISLDDVQAFTAANRDPQGFIARQAGPVVIDEVQRVPELFRAIKMAVDDDPTPGRFLLTGSADALVLPQMADSLAGRVELFTLWPLSQGEIESAPERFVDRLFDPAPMRPSGTLQHGPTLIDRVLRGGFPEAVARPDGSRQSAWHAAYAVTALERAVQDLRNVDERAELPRLLTLVASRVGGLLNSSDLSRSLSIPTTTLRRHMALLGAAFLVITIPAWSSNLGLRLTKSPKVFVVDTGLAASLLGLDHARLDADATLRGGLVENFVVMELAKQAGWSRVRPTLYHFRSTAGAEVDLVLEDNAGRVVGIEIKSGAAVKPSAFSGLRALAEATGERFVRGIVLYDGPTAVPFGPRMDALPIASLWGGG